MIARSLYIMEKALMSWGGKNKNKKTEDISCNLVIAYLLRYFVQIKV